MALTPELNRLVDALVASGAYNSASEGMWDGSPALIDRRERSAAELAAACGWHTASPKRIAATMWKDPAKRLCGARLSRHRASWPMNPGG